MITCDQLRQILDVALAQICLDHPGPFVVVEPVSMTVIGPYTSIPDAVAGVEQWRTELEQFGHEDDPVTLRVEPLFSPVKGAES